MWSLSNSGRPVISAVNVNDIILTMRPRVVAVSEQIMCLLISSVKATQSTMRLHSTVHTNALININRVTGVKFMTAVTLQQRSKKAVCQNSFEPKNTAKEKHAGERAFLYFIM